jgi:hypothetical protein
MECSPPPQRQREPEAVEPRLGEPAQTSEFIRACNERVSGDLIQDEQEQMRCQDEDEVNFTNQTGTHYSSKLLSTNASEHMAMVGGNGKGYAHLSPVQSSNSPLHRQQGNHAIRASDDFGEGDGWDSGLPVWDPSTPIDSMQSQRQNTTPALEDVEINRYSTEQSRCLASINSPSGNPQAENKWGDNSVITAEIGTAPEHATEGPATPKQARCVAGTIPEIALDQTKHRT